MEISSVSAAAVTDPAALGRVVTDPGEWHDEIDHMNPLGHFAPHAGQRTRFEPPWGEMICVVTASDGSWGVGFGSLAGLTVPLVNDYLAPMLRGDDPADVERLWDMMAMACGSHFGAAGVASYAISPVDLALWDLRGKLSGEPVHRLVQDRRTPRRSPLSCYATTPQVSDALAMGYEAVKLPCEISADRGAAIERTVARVARARAELGDRPLMLDCWGVQEVDHAVEIAAAVTAFAPAWVEDPIFPEDWPGYRALRALLPDVTLAAGERWYTVGPFRQAVEEGWVDIVQPDPLWVGGATPTVRIADVALEGGVGLALHCGANDAYGQHLAYGLAENLWAEMYIGSAVTPGEAHHYRSTPGMAVPDAGVLVPHDAAGFGVELNLSDIERATG